MCILGFSILEGHKHSLDSASWSRLDICTSAPWPRRTALDTAKISANAGEHEARLAEVDSLWQLLYFEKIEERFKATE